MVKGVKEEVVLGKRLQQARRGAGLTQQALCHKSGLSYSTLAKIERGAIKAPSIFTIQSIAEVLNTSLDNLIGHSFAPPPKKRSKSGIRFVYFDVNGCLVRFYHRAFTRLAEDTQASPDIIETTFWHYNDTVCRGDMTVEQFNKIFAEKLGVKSLKWQDYYLDAVDPIKSMHNLVGWAANNYQIGLLTNIMPGLLPQMIERGLIPAVNYSAIIDSSEVHAIKPEAKVFKIAQSKSDCQPGEILLVDDSRPNLMAAEKAGWRVLWYDDYQTEESTARVRKALEFED